MVSVDITCLLRLSYPPACANFKALCTGEKGVSETTGVRLSYINSVIHRIVPGGWIQGGDIVDGSGGGYGAMSYTWLAHLKNFYIS